MKPRLLDALGAGQRDALTQSEKKAAERQPDNFKDVENGEKVIEIGPDLTNAPIEGIDPPSDSERCSPPPEKKS